MANEFFHASGMLLAPGSVVLPGNFGRIIHKLGPAHNLYQYETALELSRVVKYPQYLSRLGCVFLWASYGDYLAFRAQDESYFRSMVMYKVEIVDLEAPCLISRMDLCRPNVLPNYDMEWANKYWDAAIERTGKEISSMDMQPGIIGIREILCNSSVRIIESIDSL